MLEVCVHPCTVMGRMEIEVLGGEKKKKKTETKSKPLQTSTLLRAKGHCPCQKKVDCGFWEQGLSFL